MVDSKKKQKAVRTWFFSRGTALFLGTFALLNVLASLLGACSGAGLWWVDFSAPAALMGEWGAPVVLVFQLLAGLGLLFWGIWPDGRAWRRVATCALTLIFALVAFWNAIVWWQGLGAGQMTALVPVPLSCAIGLALLVLCARVWKCRGAARVGTGPRGVVGIVFAALACIFVFPLLQVATFGTTDYRSAADAVAVPGAQLKADGSLPAVLRERVDMAVGLYDDAKVAHIVVLGGTDASGFNEAAAMAACAREEGVPADALVEDAGATSLSASVTDAAELAGDEGWDTLLVTSSFYQMPRLKMLYLAQGRDVRTVPVFGDLAVNGTPEALLREIPAWWACWFACYL